MTRKDKASEIRKVLKAKYGWNARQVSVRTSRGGSLRVTVKDSTVQLHKVEAVANVHESISRCEYSHEILSGGNTFVFVDYDHDLVREKAARLEPLLSDEPGKSVVVEGFKVCRENDSHNPGSKVYNICKDGGNLNANIRSYNKGCAAESLAIAIMDEGFEHCGTWVGA